MPVCMVSASGAAGPDATGCQTGVRMSRGRQAPAYVAIIAAVALLAACDGSPAPSVPVPTEATREPSATTAATPPSSTTSQTPSPSSSSTTPPSIPDGYRAAVPGPTVTATKVKRAPTIDGATSDWAGFPTYAVDTRIGGQRSVKSVATSVWRLGWDAGNLYVLAVVTDPALTQTHPLRPWAIGTGDSIAIEIGPYTNPVRIDRLAARDTRILIGPAESGGTLRAVAGADGAGFATGTTWRTGSAVALRTASGWRVEAAIPWSTLRVDKPGPGAKLSLNLLLADAIPSGAKRGSLGALYSNNPQRIFAGAKARYAWGRLALAD